MTRTPLPLLRALEARDGRQCAWHEVGQCDPETLVPQHRASRGMGGYKGGSRLSNLLWLDSLTNGLIESDESWADAARDRGIKISRYENPETIPVTHAVHGRCLLGDDGSVNTGIEVF